MKTATLRLIATARPSRDQYADILDTISRFEAFRGIDTDEAEAEAERIHKELGRLLFAAGAAAVIANGMFYSSSRCVADQISDDPWTAGNYPSRLILNLDRA